MIERATSATQKTSFLSKLCLTLLTAFFITSDINSAFSISSFERPESAKFQYLIEAEIDRKNNSSEKFRSIIDSARNEYLTARNNIIKTEARQNRRRQLASAFENVVVTDWIGFVVQLDTTSDGMVIFGVVLDQSDIELSTWNNALSDIFDNSLIKSDSAIYRQLRSLGEGDKIKFSGSFFSDESDFFTEKSLTEEVSMMDPEFLFKFHSVTLIQQS